MNVLAVDTSGPVAGVALARDGRIVFEETVINRRTHSVNLMPMVDDALRRSTLTLEQLDRLAVVVGPGSFTGVRIGVSTVKGLSHGSGVPCVAVNALEALAVGLPCADGILCPIQDARAGQVYGAAFAWGVPPRRLLPDAPIALEDFVRQAADLGERLYFLGDGMPVHRAALTRLLGVRACFAPPHLADLRPASVALLGSLPQAQTVDYLTLAPMYLRPPQAERNRALQEAMAHAEV